MRRFICTILPFIAALTACTDEDTPFNELDRLRILGIRAEPPWLLEGETASVDFLGVNNDPNLAGVPIRTRWHFCPLQADSTVGFECFIQSPEQLTTITGTTGLPDVLAAATFTEFGVLFGTDSSVDIPFILPPELIAQVCEQLDGIDLPTFVTRPACNGRFPITVYLEQGPPDPNQLDDDTAIDPARRLVGFRDIDLVYDTTLETNTPNRNPEIADVRVAPTTSSRFTLTTTTSTTPLKFDTTYNLEVDVGTDQAERFTPSDDDDPDQESLIVTWFIEGGETDSVRTGFLPADDDDFSDLDSNVWTTPRRVDFEERTGLDCGTEVCTTQLFLVIRDNRGGLSWTIRTFELNDRTGL
ncbi:MAG: hypothetical protein AAFN74_00570 [Myxococcota bacterium]